MTSYVRFIIRYRLLVLTSIVVVTVLLASCIGQLEVKFELDDLLPDTHPFVQAHKKIERLFGGQNFVLVGVVPREGSVFTPKVMRHVQRLTAAISGLPGVDNVLSLTAPRVRSVQSGPEGIVVDPVMEDDITPETVALARKRLERSPLYRNAILGVGERATAVAFDLNFNTSIPDQRALRARLDAILAAERDPSLDYLLGGQPIFAAALADKSQRVLGFFPLAILIIGLIHWEAFRTFQGFALPLVTALLSVVWGLGVMGAMGIPIDPINVSTPILILAVAAGHAVQMLKRYYEELAVDGDNTEAVVRATSLVGVPMIAAGSVAAVAFFSLMAFETASVRYFGVFTGLGIVSAVILEMTFIPALRSLLPAPRVNSDREGFLDRLLAPMLRWVAARVAGRGARRVVAGYLIGFGLCVLAASRLQADNASRTYFGPGDLVLQQDAELNRLFAGTHTLELLFESAEPGGLLQPNVLRAMDDVAHQLAKFPVVGNAVSIVDLIKSLHEAMDKDAWLRDPIPTSPRRSSQLLFLYGMSDSRGVELLADPEYRMGRILTFARDDSTKTTGELIAGIQKYVATVVPEGITVSYAGSLATNYAWNEVMVHGKLLNIVQVTALIILVGALVFRSLVAGMLIGAPLLFAVVVVFASMALYGIRLDIGTATIAAMSVGLGADFSIYLLYRVREECRRGRELHAALTAALDSAGRAIVYVSSAVVGGYLTLCFTGSVIHARLGGLVSLAIIVAATTVIIGLPAAICLLRPSFLAIPGASENGATAVQRARGAGASRAG